MGATWAGVGRQVRGPRTRSHTLRGRACRQVRTPPVGRETGRSCTGSAPRGSKCAAEAAAPRDPPGCASAAPTSATSADCSSSGMCAAACSAVSAPWWPSNTPALATAARAAPLRGGQRAGAGARCCGWGAPAAEADDAPGRSNSRRLWRPPPSGAQVGLRRSLGYGRREGSYAPEVLGVPAGRRPADWAVHVGAAGPPGMWPMHGRCRAPPQAGGGPQPCPCWLRGRERACAAAGAPGGR